MQFQIRNYRGISSADFEHTKLTIIGGDNHQGKTSIAEAVASVLSGNTMPISGITKSMSKGIIRDGAKTASAVMNNGETSAAIEWPKGEYTSAGMMRPISMWSAGLESLVDTKKKERMQALSPYVQAEPTPEDLENELKSQNVQPEVIVKVQESVKINGWDTAHAKAKEKGVLLKGQWQEVTQERYGSLKASSWYPAGWYPELSGKSEESLQAVIYTANKEVELAIAVKAITEAEEKNLRDEGALFVARTAEWEKQKALMEENEKKIAEIKAKIREIIAPLSVEATPCPHCGKDLMVKLGKIEKSEKISPDLMKKIEAEKVLLEKSERESVVRHKKLAQQVGRLHSEMETSRAAKEQVDNMGDKPAEKTADDAEKAKEALQKAKNDLAAIHAYNRSQSLANAIVLNQIIVDILAPTGLRETKLTKAMQPLNNRMAELSVAANWDVVRLDPSFEIYLGSRLYHFCSKSEQFKCRTILQLATAAIKLDTTVIIDEADIIVSKVGRMGLVKAILANRVPAMVMMSLKDRSELPAAEKVGGKAYWVENGVLS